MNDLSPEAARACHDADVRHRLYARSRRVTLARNATRAIIKRPSWEGRKYQREVATWLAVNLPQFRFNSKLNWWEAPLTELPAAAERLQKYDLVTLSDGAKQYLEEVKIDGKESNPES